LASSGTFASLTRQALLDAYALTIHNPKQAGDAV
jgi:hypothetical protein